MDGASIYDEYTDEINLPGHLRCSTHTLNLVCTTDIKNILELEVNAGLKARHDCAMSKCVELWKKQRTSKQCEIFEKHLQCALKRPVITRWHSLKDSVSDVVDVQPDLTQEFYEEVGIPEYNRLDEEDFEFLKEYLFCVEDVAYYIDKLQGDKHMHYGFLSPCLISLRNKLTLKLNETEKLKYCRPLIIGLLKSVEKRFQNFFEVKDEGRFAAIAATVHPRFKTEWMQSLPSKVQKEIQDAVFSEAKEIYKNTVKKRVINSDFMFQAVPSTSTPNTTSVNNAGDFKIVCILSNYINSEVTDKFDEVLGNDVIQEMFIKFNTPLPSSASCERFFTYSTMANVPKYNRLNDTNFEIRVCLKANFSFFF